MALWINENIINGAIVIFIVSCGTAPKPSDTLAAANMAALEQTVDMENNTVETDDVLKFGQSVVDLGEIPVGESRELSLEAVNRVGQAASAARRLYVVPLH